MLLLLLNRREVIREVLKQHLPSNGPDNHRTLDVFFEYGRLKMGKMRQQLLGLSFTFTVFPLCVHKLIRIFVFITWAFACIYRKIPFEIDNNMYEQ